MASKLSRTQDPSQNQAAHESLPKRKRCSNCLHRSARRHLAKATAEYGRAIAQFERATGQTSHHGMRRPALTPLQIRPSPLRSVALRSPPFPHPTVYGPLPLPSLVLGNVPGPIEELRTAQQSTAALMARMRTTLEKQHSVTRMSSRPAAQAAAAAAAPSTCNRPTVGA